ncbi:MAG: hypothetical protein HYX63_21120 [Gammaproteobacteria bacterium]|nr:hypothetical protein [Gammaproteobacteria bacterium]
MNSRSRPASRNASLCGLLYLYIWPFWMFKDVTFGTFMERAAAFRHNQARRVFLPRYMLRWIAVLVMLVELIALFETFGPTNLVVVLLSTAAGILTAWAAVVEMMILATYFCLTHWIFTDQ